MFLRHKIRRKDGKEHRSWSVVDNRRVQSGRVVQRQVLDLGEINDTLDLGGRSVRQIATDRRTVLLTRRTEPETDHLLVLQRLKLELPAQPPPKITAATDAKAA